MKFAEFCSYAPLPNSASFMHDVELIVDFMQRHRQSGDNFVSEVMELGVGCA
jgi:hypothetical protein